MRQSTRSRATAAAADPAEGSSARSSARLVSIFGALARSEEGMSLAELSLALGAPKSSLLGQLRAMVSASYLAHAHGMYRLGPRSFRLAADILDANVAAGRGVGFERRAHDLVLPGMAAVL